MSNRTDGRGDVIAHVQPFSKPADSAPAHDELYKESGADLTGFAERAAKHFSESAPVQSGLLSDRVRPDSEAAPWVVEAIKKLEAGRAAEWERAENVMHEMCAVINNERARAEAAEAQLAAERERSISDDETEAYIKIRIAAESNRANIWEKTANALQTRAEAAEAECKKCVESAKTIPIAMLREASIDWIHHGISKTDTQLKAVAFHHGYKVEE